MAHTDVAPRRMVDKLQKAHNGIKIIQRLADAHQYNVRNRQTGFLFGKQHLVKHFRRREIPDKPADGRSAECAPLPAADLRRDADSVAVVVAHNDRFHGVAVRQLPEVFDCSVLGGLLLSQNPRSGERTALGQLAAQRKREIRHLVPRPAAGGKPAEKLLCPVRRLSERTEKLRQLVRQHGFNINFLGTISHFVSCGSKRSRPCRNPAAG